MGLAGPIFTKWATVPLDYVIYFLSLFSFLYISTTEFYLL